MNKEKYKSVVVDVDTYKFIKDMAFDDERAISKTLKLYFTKGVEAEAGETLLDSKLVEGGTPRLKRLLEDLRWYRDNADNGHGKKYILNKDEQHALLVVIDALADTLNLPPVKNVQIEDIGLPGHIVTRLYKHNIRTLDRLVRVGKKKLASMDEIGGATINVLDKKIKQLGLVW